MTKEQQLLQAAAAGDLVKLNQLIDEGADVAYQDPETGMSALMHAADERKKEAVEMLLEAGTPWNLLDKDGYCAGEYAAGCPELVELLLGWGAQAEMVLGAAERASRSQSASTSSAVNSDYLQQKLHYSADGTKLLDADGEAVMMGWEGPLMERHAEVICSHGPDRAGPDRGGDVLNVGFGLGLVDEAIQRHRPRSHTIIEAHPDVYKHALDKGWDKRANLLLGRWQDVLPTLGDRKFDGIFFDTYGEYYGEMSDFHELLPKLLKPGGVYSFFNGLAPDNIFFHTVEGRVAQLELETLGLTTSYERVAIKEAIDEEVWKGVKNKYWKLPFYFLPTCVFNTPQQS
mmetsp:Transcript_1768/g.4461  ORF Transcript_1768/g.4461 Transcript_1768/m.4461 type:complete len:344 (+) Transcript_1768:49-1080(+)